MLEVAEKHKFNTLLETNDKNFSRAILYSDSVREKLLQSYSIDLLQTYLSTWSSIQLLSTQFSYFESQSSTFTGCYFESVKWLASSFKDTQFINCVFRNCDWQLEPHSEIVFQECIFENTKLMKLESITYKNCMLPKLSIEASPPPEKEKVSAGAVSKTPEAKPTENSRFKILER